MRGSSKIRVLIVDDSASVRQTLKAVLESDPAIEVIATASDPFVAVERIRDAIPDVITLDIEMPKMDGLTFLDKVMSQHPIPIVICSNWDWDLREAVAESNLTDAVDAMVSSAWVGARKPHPRIFAAALAEADVPAADVLFVGDTWGPDVAGPIEMGFRPLYLRRAGHWPDVTAPPTSDGVAIAADLNGILDLLDG